MSNPTNNKIVSVSEAELARLRQLAAKDQEYKDKRREYRAKRNAQPETKQDNAKYHEKRNRKMRVAVEIVEYVLGSKWLSSDQCKELRAQLPALESFITDYREDPTVVMFELTQEGV